MTYKKGSKKGSNPLGGRFIAIPWRVLDSAAYLALNKVERALLVEMARQYNGRNNGQLRCNVKRLRARGFTSAGTLNRAKRVLLAAGLLYETCMGSRPAKASWYALPWFGLDAHRGFDPHVLRDFPMNGARKYTLATIDSVSQARRDLSRKKVVIPAEGIDSDKHVPDEGLIMEYLVPYRGTVGEKNFLLPVPHEGNHLDVTICERSIELVAVEVERLIGFHREAMSDSVIPSEDSSEALSVLQY